MQHLNTKQCECGHSFTAHDKTGRLEPITQRGLYGGNVKAFADGQCPACGKEYKLWLRQAKNSWEVVTISATGNQEAATDSAELDEFDHMDKDELKSWLDDRSVKYTPNWGEKRLRELCRSFKTDGSEDDE